MEKPEIRFKGYTDEWEQRKLSELSEKTFGGGTPKTSNESFWKGNIPWIQSSDLIEGSLFDVKPRKHISQEAVDKSATKLVPENSVAIVTRVGVGKLVFMPFSYATSQDFLSLSNLKTESQFTVYALYKKLQSELNAVQGTSIKGVTKDELLAKKVTIPCYEEQEKIGSYLHSLDNLITLHQRKCDEVKSLKKYMLQKMFPQNEQKVPEIRFEGFTEAWEQRKVGEFLTESRESGHKGDVAHKMTVKLWGKGVYEKNDAGSVNTQYFTRHAGQFIYSKLDFLNCAFGVVPEELESLETTADVPAFDCDGVNPHFMFYTAIQPSFYEKNGMIADGSRKAKRIHVDTFLDMPFIVPSLEEQNKIVNLLSGLDDLLTLHQQKCEELKKIKKFMLQKMFV